MYLEEIIEMSIKSKNTQYEHVIERIWIWWN